MKEFITLLFVWGLAGWGIFTRKPEHDGIGRMLTAILIILVAIFLKL